MSQRVVVADLCRSGESFRRVARAAVEKKEAMVALLHASEDKECLGTMEHARP